MNPHHNSNQNPPSTSAVQQVVNPVMNQQMFNGHAGPLFPNSMPMLPSPGFINFPNQFPNDIGGFNPQQNFIPFPVTQFNPSQQQPGQNFIAYRPNVSLPGQQALMQNINQLLQLQNPNYTQCFPGNFPMFPPPIVNVMNPQNPGFVVNQQFGMSSGNGPQNMGPQLQGRPFLPSGNGSVQTQQIPQGVGPQNQNFFTNQMFGMANLNGSIQPGFVSPMMVNTGQTHNTNVEDNNKNVPTNVNGGWTESQQKNFTGHKTYDPSHKGSKFQRHVKQKFGNYKGNMNKEGGSNLEVDSVSQNFTFEKKVPALNYTQHEIKEWREARKKNYPTRETVSKKHTKEQTLSDVTNQNAVLRRQQLKEILAKQAELGCEVADIPGSYLSSPEKQNSRERKHGRQNPRERKRERQQQYKKGKFHNKRGASFQDVDRIGNKARPGDQDSFNGNHETKPKKREPSLLEKLLTRDIKRDKTHLLQVLRFMTANSFFTEESLRFPPVIVRETNGDVPSKETTCSVVKETNIDVPSKETTCSVVKETNVDVASKETACSVVKVEVEEGEIID